MTPGTRLTVCALLLFAALTAAEDRPAPVDAAAAAAAGIEFRPSKYADEPRYRELAAEAMPLRQRAVEAIRRRLDIDYDDQRTIRIRFQDLAPDGSASKAENMAQRITETVDGKEVAVIVLYWEYLISGAGSLKDELTHEFFHAVHREQITKETYTAIPRWVREGLALYVAEQMPGRLDYLLQDKIEQGPDVLVQGLENDPHTLDDYGEDVLAFDYLETRHGRERFLAVAQDIVFGRRTAREAIRKHTDEDWPTFREHARQHTLTALRTREGGRRDLYLPVLKRYLADDCAGALTGFQALLHDHPEAYWRGLAQYYLARSLFQLKRYDEAGGEFAKTVADHAGRIGLVDDAAYYVGRCAFECGRWAEAELALRRFLRDFPYATYFGKGMLFLGRALAEQGKLDDARRWLTGAAEGAVKADVGASALWHRSLVEEKAGQPDAARAAREELVRRFPKAAEAAWAKKKLDEPKSKE